MCLNDDEISMISDQWWHFLVPFINGVVELLNLVPNAEVVFIGDFMEGCSNFTEKIHRFQKKRSEPN